MPNNRTQGRLVVGAAFLLLVATLAGACDDGDSPVQVTPTGAATAAITSAPAATTTRTATTSFADQLRERADLPGNDARDLAARYGRTDGLAPEAKPFTRELNVGDRRNFNVLTITVNPVRVNDVPATLRAKSEHAYFFVADTLDVSASSVEAAAATFESVTWPRVTGVFGEPLAPGIDGDPRIIVLQADLGGAGGYRSLDDVYLRTVRPLSNEAEMVYLDRTLPIGGAAFDVVLAHEFQHLIQSNNDQSEEAWIDEGLSENASGLVGGAVSYEQAYAARPDTQLNHWAGGNVHYGASAAFLRYLADRYGGDAALGDIARAEADGAAGIEEFLAERGESARFAEIFATWIVANVLDVTAGPYAAGSRPLRIKPDASLAVGASVDGDVAQFGVDYYALDGLDGGEYELRFDGSEGVPVLPAWTPGADTWWSNTSDDIDTTLTRELDLTNAADAALTFELWADVERWYDWAYVAASTDGGATWEPLTGEHTTADDPVQQAYGVGYTGTTGGSEPAWVEERIDLQPYAGQRILLRFEYVTDGSTHGEGLAIDDVRLDGALLDDAGWDAVGWLKVDQALPQTYILRLIAEATDGTPVVRDVPLDASAGGTLRFDAAGLSGVVVAIAGSTEGTTQRAPYSITLVRP